MEANRVGLTPLQQGSDPADCLLGICISSECAGEGGGWGPSALLLLLRLRLLLLLLLKGQRGSRWGLQGRSLQTALLPALIHQYLLEPVALSQGCPGPPWTAAPQTEAARATAGRCRRKRCLIVSNMNCIVRNLITNWVLLWCDDSLYTPEKDFHLILECDDQDLCSFSHGAVGVPVYHKGVRAKVRALCKSLCKAISDTPNVDSLTTLALEAVQPQCCQLGD